MATDLTPLTEPLRRRWTLGEVLALYESGALAFDDRTELLDGVIVSVSPKNAPHNALVHRIRRRLEAALGDRALVREEKTLLVAFPDVVIALSEAFPPQ